MNLITDVFFDNAWHKVYDKILVDGSTRYLCENKETGELKIINPSHIEMING